MSVAGALSEGSLTEQMTRGAVMRKKWTLAAAAAGACATLIAPRHRVGGRERAGDDQSAAGRGLHGQHRPRGTAPLSECVVTNVRNPKTVQQWVPYIGPGSRGFDGDRALVLRNHQPVDLGDAGLQPPLSADRSLNDGEGPAGGGTGRAFLCARPTPASGHSPAPVLRRARLSLMSPPARLRGRRRPWSARRTDRRRRARR